MRTSTVAVFLVAFLLTVFASSQERPSRSDKDISAIGHRSIGGDRGLGNWYSLDREKELGEEQSAEVDQSSKILDDPALTNYVARIAGKISSNSDSQFPITVRIIDSDRVEAFTLLGGYQYITRGLLLQLNNESELASVLARGIAHTALRSSTRIMTREQYANIGMVPLILTSSSTISSDRSDSGVPLTMLKFRRGYEAAADYFGVQYVYKAGYSTIGFSQIIQKIWPVTHKTSNSFDPFPPTAGRLSALQKEISEILPERGGAIVSTPEFEQFKKHLLALGASESTESSK